VFHSRRHISSSLALLSAIFLLVPGCTDHQPIADSAVKILDHSGLPVVRLQPDTLSAADALGQPSQLALIGGHLWVADRAEEPFLHLLDTATGQVVKSLGRLGEGPEDFTLILSLFANFGDDSVRQANLTFLVN
jgi:hypothetical protein